MALTKLPLPAMDRVEVGSGGEIKEPSLEIKFEMLNTQASDVELTMRYESRLKMLDLRQ